MNRVMFSSASPHWNTPVAVFDELNTEFHFDDDPCPPGGLFGLDRPWGKATYVNPPYSQIAEWMEKGFAEYQQGKTIVFLIPARTDTRWFHKYVLPLAEIRFIKGRLKFTRERNGKIEEGSAPFPSMIVIFRGARP